MLSEVPDAANRPSEAVRRLAYASAVLETRIENPLDAAIVAAGDTAGLTTVGLPRSTRSPRCTVPECGVTDLA